MDCLFCRIAKKEIPSNDVYETGDAFAFLDIHPRSPGHTMIIPKEHAENISKLSPDKVGPLFQAVQEVVIRLEKSLNPSGFTIGVNHGRAAGAEVDHLHVHVIPRFTGDQGKSIQSIVGNIPKESLEDIAKKIKAV